jgi:hypothetical protein
VQRGAGIRAQANHVAGVRRDLGTEQDDMQHPVIIACPRTLAVIRVACSTIQSRADHAIRR